MDEMKEGARIYLDTDLTIQPSKLTQLIFNKVRWDTDNMFDICKPTRLTCNTAGVYIINAQAMWSEHPGGMRQLTIKLNGVSCLATDRKQDCEGWGSFTHCSTHWKLQKDDYIEAEAFWWNPRYRAVRIPYELMIMRANHLDSPEFMAQRIG